MDDSAPLVSVIIPSYRSPEYLNQAVASVLRQSFTDYEIIVVDDASGDETVARFDLPPSVRLLRRMANSGGPSAPRNDGARVARGRYLAFLDQDDVWLPEKLARQVAVLDQHPDVALTFCHSHMVNESLAPAKTQRPVPRVEADLLKQLIASCMVCSTSSTLIRRSVFDAVGGFDDAMIPCDDWDLYLRLAAVSRFIVEPDPLFQYRLSSAQQTNDERRMCWGSITVLLKTHAWVAQQRLDLVPWLLRQLSLRYYQYAKQQIHAGDDPTLVARSLRAAVAYSPFSLRTYRGFRLLAGYRLRRWLQRRPSAGDRSRPALDGEQGTSTADLAGSGRK